MAETRNKKKGLPIRGILMVIFGLIFVFSGYMVLSTELEGRQEQSAFDELSRMMAESTQIVQPSEQAEQENVSAASETEDPDTISAQVQAKLDWYSQLQEQYPDFCAWLTVPGTDVDYPVMYTPDVPDYYLHRAFDGSTAKSGTPFLGDGCDVDSDCVLVYGHNMKNGTMFGSLDEYKDKTFGRENPQICFDTPEGVRTYTIFAAVKCSIPGLEEDGMRYYNYAGDLDEEQYAEIVGWLTEQSLYDLGDAPEHGEQIIILSTCSYHTDEGRFLVAAYRTE